MICIANCDTYTYPRSTSGGQLISGKRSWAIERFWEASTTGFWDDGCFFFFFPFLCFSVGFLPFYWFFFYVLFWEHSTASFGNQGGLFIFIEIMIYFHIYEHFKFVPQKNTLNSWTFLKLGSFSQLVNPWIIS